MESDTEGRGGPARVLLVGDDPRDATMMVKMLRDAWPDGLLVTQTGNVADAVHELADHGDSCVLLDLAGEDLGALRALVSAAPSAAVLVVSDHGADDFGVAAVTAGAQDHLRRGELNPTLLTRAVRYALERKRAETRLTRQALEDPLTGLPNRVLFLDRLSGALDRSRRTGLAPAVMFLDVDSFKAVNDSLGHGAGDRLLRTLAERFGEMLRPMDTVARLGGDEFTFLFEGLTGSEEALAIARRIGDAAAQPVVLGERDGEISVAVSIGVEMLEDPQVELEDALGGADAAMYRAKSLGGGRAELIEAWPEQETVTASPGPNLNLDLSFGQAQPRAATLASVPAHPKVSETPEVALEAADAEVADALRRALARDELRVHYQPRVSFDGRTGLVGFEALVRWAHPERGLLSPGEFMADAERTGLVREIGDWVIGEALAQVHRWRQSRPGMTISVNLSRRQLLDPGLAERLRARLRGYGLPASTLWLEVSESAIRADPAAAGRALRDLHEVGVMIAVDDFGGGDAAPPELRELPVAMLKIDRAVVSRVEGAGGGRHVEGVVGLGHELGLSVVAEGVETDHQLAHIRELGCDGAQGFLFSRPVPEDSVAELLGTR